MQKRDEFNARVRRTRISKISGLAHNGWNLSSYEFETKRCLYNHPCLEEHPPTLPALPRVNYHNGESVHARVWPTMSHVVVGLSHPSDVSPSEGHSPHPSCTHSSRDDSYQYLKLVWCPSGSYGVNSAIGCSRPGASCSRGPCEPASFTIQSSSWNTVSGQVDTSGIWHGGLSQLGVPKPVYFHVQCKCVLLVPWRYPYP